MRKIVLSLIVFGLFSFGFSTAVTDSSAVQIELKASLEANQVPKNREAIYHVSLSWKGDLDRFHILDVSEPAVTNLQIRGSGSSNKFYLDDSGNPYSIKRITYYFLPKEMGMAYIDGLTIRYKDTVNGKTGVLTAQRLQVTITEPVMDSNGGGLGVIVFWVLLSLFLILVAFFVYRYFQRRDEADAAPVEEKKSLEDEKLEILMEINKSGDLKYNEKVQQMSRLLNGYFSEKFGMEGQLEFKDIEEPLTSLSLEAGVIAKIKDFMERATLAKFAGEEVSETDYQLYYDTLEMLFGKMSEIGSKTEEEE
jgi:cbb3-type cytochrome oxidase subunit 3